MPPSFDFGSVFAPGQRMDIYVPAIMDQIRDWGNTLALVGRLKPGVSMAQAQAALAPRFHQWVATTATTDGERAKLPALILNPGAEGLGSLRRQYSKPLFVLLLFL